MPHLTVQGVTFPGEADSFTESGEFVGDVTGRSQNGTLVEARTTRKRRWSVRSVFVGSAEADAWRLALEGDGHHWALATHAVSDKGVGSIAGSFSFTTFTPTTGTIGCVEVTSGGTIQWNLANVMGPRWTTSSGWTAIVLREDRTLANDSSNGFFRYMVIGSGAFSGINPAGSTQYRDATSGTFSVGHWFAMTSDGVVSLAGRGNIAGVNAIHRYAQLTILPFALPASWQSAIATQTSARQTAGLPFLSELPRISLGGDAIPDTNGATCVARVGSLDQRNVRLAGSHANNARILTVEFIEV